MVEPIDVEPIHRDTIHHFIVGEAPGDDELFTPEEIDSMITYPEDFDEFQINRRWCMRVWRSACDDDEDPVQASINSEKLFEQCC